MAIDKIEIAERIIAEVFSDKLDLGGSPYENHCFRVKAKIEKVHPHIDKDVFCIALLHDLLEDCVYWTPNALRAFFSQRVVDGILSLTKSKKETYEDYISRVMQNNDAILVKKYDLIDNMDLTRLKDFTDKDAKRIEKYHRAFKRLTA